MSESATLPHLFEVWGETTEKIIRSDACLLGFDFDGTLAPIVDDPVKARMNPQTSSYLTELSRSGSSSDRDRRVVVAILSGRSRTDLSQKVELDEVALAGDHGLSIRLMDGRLHQGDHLFDPRQFGFLLAQVKSRTASVPDVLIEPKQYSITVHYRESPRSAGKRLRGILSSLIKDTPYHLQAGRKCWELNPNVNWNKGDAFDWIEKQTLADYENVFKLYAGDDRTDEDVFRRLNADDCPILIVSSEKEGKTNARYRLDSQQETEELLGRLVDVLARRN